MRFARRTSFQRISPCASRARRGAELSSLWRLAADATSRNGSVPRSVIEGGHSGKGGSEPPPTAEGTDGVCPNRVRMFLALDHRHRDGRVTPFELKDVKRLEPKHLRQADEYQAAIERTYGVPTNRTVILVPPHTLVSAKLAARGDIERLPRKRRSR